MNEIIDYIKSCVNLYGIVSKEKIVEIYNMQNTDQISLTDIDDYISNHDLINEELIGIKNGYFVCLSILAVDTFDEILSMKKDKPWYIPDKGELLKYIDPEYFEYNMEFEDLFKFFKKKHFFMNKAYTEASYIQSICRSKRALNNIEILLKEENIKTKNNKEKKHLMELINKLAENTRRRENNGYTNSEISEILNKSSKSK